MTRHLLAVLVLFTPFTLLSQSLSGDSLFANERSIDRPVTMHSRQFRITGTYDLALISRRFDSSWEKVSLAEEGLQKNTRHRFVVDFKYGITPYIQLNTALGYSTNTVRAHTQYILPAAPPIVAHDIVHQYEGLEDLYLGVDLRAPLKTSKIDLALTLGATLPVAPFEPREPRHSFHATEENGISVDKFQYNYHHPMGTGVTIVRVGGLIKYRTSSWAVSARIDYQHGLKEGSSYEWSHQLQNGSFEYRQQSIRYRLPDSNTYYVEGEYQATPWLDVFMTVSGHTSFHGWTAHQDNVKVATSYQTIWQLAPGFEIILTPRLWVRERIALAMAGKDYEAPLGFETTLMYNFFPAGGK